MPRRAIDRQIAPRGWVPWWTGGGGGPAYLLVGSTRPRRAERLILACGWLAGSVGDRGGRARALGLGLFGSPRAKANKRWWTINGTRAVATRWRRALRRSLRNCVRIYLRSPRASATGHSGTVRTHHMLIIQDFRRMTA